jgi:hypothetical protein
MLHATGNLHILDRRVEAGTRFGKPHGAAPFAGPQFGDELMSPLFSIKPAEHPFFVLAFDVINGLIIEPTSVMPAKAGIQEYLNWFPAFAGKTTENRMPRT